jgi:hypothetical protein
MRAGRVMQGGSTITQQLIKNRLLGARRTFWRKLNEAWLATLVEWRYSKAQILEAYLNEIYLGQRGGLAVRGVGAARACTSARRSTSSRRRRPRSWPAWCARPTATPPSSIPSGRGCAATWS